MSFNHPHPTVELRKVIERAPETETQTVIVVRFRRGQGCCEDDPVREVTAYYSLDGELLAERDPR